MCISIWPLWNRLIMVVVVVNDNFFFFFMSISFIDVSFFLSSVDIWRFGHLSFTFFIFPRSHSFTPFFFNSTIHPLAISCRIGRNNNYWSSSSSSWFDLRKESMFFFLFLLSKWMKRKRRSDRQTTNDVIWFFFWPWLFPHHHHLWPLNHYPSRRKEIEKKIV